MEWSSKNYLFLNCIYLWGFWWLKVFKLFYYPHPPPLADISPKIVFACLLSWKSLIKTFSKSAAKVCEKFLCAKWTTLLYSRAFRSVFLVLYKVNNSYTVYFITLKRLEGGHFIEIKSYSGFIKKKPWKRQFFVHRHSGG